MTRSPRLTQRDLEVIGMALGLMLAGPIEGETDDEAERLRADADAAHAKISARQRPKKSQR